MKKHNILKVVLLSILAVILLTWILPSASFTSELVVGERNQVGIFNIITYFMNVFRYFPYVILMALVTGMFYGVAYKIPAYRLLLDKIVKGFKGKEYIFLAVVMVLIAAIVSVTGLTYAILFVFPFVISVVLLMGYNKLVAATVTLGSTIVGILGTTLGTSTVDYLNYILGTDIYTEIITKVALLAVGLVVLIYNVVAYGKKTKNDTDKVLELVPSSVASEVKVVKAEKKEEVKETKKKETKAKAEKKTATKKTAAKKDAKAKKTTSKKTTTKKTRANDLKSVFVKKAKVSSNKTKKVHIWPFVLIFDLVVIILAVSTFNWVDICKVNWFTKALNAVEDFKLFGFPIFDKILAIDSQMGLKEFGSWSLYVEIPTLIILATCLLAFIYNLKFDDFLDGIINGIKKAMKPAIYMFMTYLVLVIVVYNPFQLNITKFLLDLTKDFNVITMTVVAMFASIFNIESVYVAQSTLPYVTSVISDSTLYPLIAVIFQSVYGLMMLVAPTSVLLIGLLSYLDVSYGQWLKHIWKLFLELLVVLVVAFLILFLI